MPISVESKAAARSGAARRTKCLSSLRCRPPRTARRIWRRACRRGPLLGGDGKLHRHPHGAAAHRRLRRARLLHDGRFDEGRPQPRGHRCRQGPRAQREIPRRQYPHRQHQDRLAGACHAIHFGKYSYRYLADVQFRFKRRYNLRAMLRSLSQALVATPKQPERGIRVAEVQQRPPRRLGVPRRARCARIG